MWILLLLAVAVIIFFWVQQNRQTGGMEMRPGETPLDILKRRYARGEIDHETFEQLKKDLGS